MILTNFEAAQPIGELLLQFGITSNIGQFLTDHLTEVLRRQQPDVQMTSLEFIESYDCSAGGMQIPCTPAIRFESVYIPLDINATVTIGINAVLLALHIVIKAESNPELLITTDVFVREQRIIV